MYFLRVEPMLINAYDSTVGKQYKLMDKVESTIKTLHISRNLKSSEKEGVFSIDHETGFTEPVFMFPITAKGFNGKLITVYDERPFRNKSNNVTNPNELEIQKLTAFLQQDVADGDMSPLKGGRLIMTKGFAESLSTRMGRRAGLDIDEIYTLKILLAYYAIGLTEKVKTELDFVSYNLIKSIYGAERGRVQGVIENTPVLNNLTELLNAIHANPILFKLKTLSLKDLIALVSGITFTSFGGSVVAAAVESPCLLTALCYGAAKFRVYNKTPLGMALDPKYNRNNVEVFLNHFHYTYNLPR